MRGVNSIYLGWENRRQAFTFPKLNPPLVVLIEEPHSRTLHDSDAAGFKNCIRELDQHLMGVAYSERMATLVRQTDPDNGAYNAIFDGYWE